MFAQPKPKPKRKTKAASIEVPEVESEAEPETPAAPPESEAPDLLTVCRAIESRWSRNDYSRNDALLEQLRTALRVATS